MLRGARELASLKIRALDGDIGKVSDLYFDDQTWRVRWVVVDTGHWLPGRKVLLAPSSLVRVEGDHKVLDVALTCEQVRHSAPANAELPVSRQHERELQRYFGWPASAGAAEEFGAPAGLWNLPPEAGSEEDARQTEQASQEPAKGDPHLRNAREVIGYRIHARDGHIGHAADFLVGDEQWAIRYFVADASNWWPGKKVLIGTGWIEEMSWAEQEIYVLLSRGQIKTSPPYDHTKPVTREYEEQLHRHYGQEPYWPQMDANGRK